MIRIEDVNEALKFIGDYSEDEIKKYSRVIENAVLSICGTADNCDDERLIYLCAVKANYDIVLITGSTDNVTSFTAGDVSITQGSTLTEHAKQLYMNALKDCSDLIKDSGFAFLGV